MSNNRLNKVEINPHQRVSSKNIDEVEKQYINVLEWYGSQNKDSKTPAIARVFSYLLANPDKVWWFAWDVVFKTAPDGSFLSHRACARLTDLADVGMCESRTVGNYTVYRLRVEDEKMIKSFKEIYKIK